MTSPSARGHIISDVAINKNLRSFWFKQTFTKTADRFELEMIVPQHSPAYLTDNNEPSWSDCCKEDLHLHLNQAYATFTPGM